MTYPTGFVLEQARVCFAAREEYRLTLGSGRELAAEPSGKLRAFDELPTAGDWVDARILGDFALIEKVHPRRTAFVRKAAGKAGGAQCVAANIDVVFLVCGLDGDFNPRRLERYLLLALQSGARPVVVLNKTDLAGASLPSRLAECEAVAPGIPIVALSAIAAAEAGQLFAFLPPGETAALLGSSGAGKSTIANALMGDARLATQAVREHDGKGRHTTTARMLMQLASGAWLLDTPGMRELGLWSVGEAAMEEVFAELAPLAAQCRYSDCQHATEPGCAVQAALLRGEIPPGRWESFQKLRRETRHLEIAADPLLAQDQKRRWKNLHKAQRQHYKLKKR